MSTTNDGGAAFGHAAENGHCCGMTIRDYFAAQAMQGIIVAYDDSRDDRAGPVVSKMAYAFADAMLAAREVM